MNEALRQLMASLADRYETASFMKDDPSWFMHQVSDPLDQEMTAFLAMCLSYGSRQQFLPKIEQLMNMAQWHPYNWIASGTFDHALTPSPQCFYRLYTFADIHALLTALHDLLCSYGTLGHFAQTAAGKADKKALCLCHLLPSTGHQGPCAHALHICLQTPLYVSSLDGAQRIACRLRAMERLHR